MAASKGGLTVTKQRNVPMYQAISFARNYLLENSETSETRKTQTSFRKILLAFTVKFREEENGGWTR